MADKGKTVSRPKHSVKQARRKLPQKDTAPGLKLPQKDTALRPKSLRKDVAPRLWWKTVLNVVGLLIWVGVSVIVSQLVVGNIMYAILGNALAEPVWEAVFFALAYLLTLGLVIWVPPKISVAWRIVNEKKDGQKIINGEAAPKALGRKELGLHGWPTWTDIGLSVVGFIVYILLAAALTGLFSSLFGWFNVEEAQDVGFGIGVAGFDRILAFAALVVIAPIAEEIIFRGWLYSKIRMQLLQKLPDWAGMLVAILLVSLLFGLVHGQWNVGVNVFALSVVLCGLREITGTIYAGILLHMLKNGVAFYLLYVLGIA